MAKKKTTPKKKAAPKKEPKFDISPLTEKELNEGSIVTIKNKRYIVQKDNKLKDKVTGEVVSY